MSEYVYPPDTNPPPKSPHHRVKSMHSAKTLVPLPQNPDESLPFSAPTPVSATSTTFSDPSTTTSPRLQSSMSNSNLHAHIASSIAAAGTLPRSHTPGHITAHSRRKTSQPELVLRSRAYSLVASAASPLPSSSSSPALPTTINISGAASVQTNMPPPSSSKPSTPNPAIYPSFPRNFDLRTAPGSDDILPSAATSAVSATSGRSVSTAMDESSRRRPTGPTRSSSSVTARPLPSVTSTSASSATSRTQGQLAAQHTSASSSSGHLSGLTGVSQSTKPADYTPQPALLTNTDGADVVLAPASGMYYSRAQVSGIPMAPVRAHTTALIGSNVYVFAGCDAKTCFNDLYVLDADSFHWSKPHVVGTIPIPLRAMTCTAVGKKLVVFGGGDGPAYYNDVYVLDTTNFRWSKPRIVGDVVPSKRRAHTACLYKNGIYIFGGGDGVRALNEIWKLDISDMNKMSWQLIYSPTPLDSPAALTSSRHLPHHSGLGPKARGYHTANIFSSKLIIYGGSDGDKCFSDVWVFDVEMGIWKSFNTSAVNRRLAHTATLVGSYLFIVGGHDGETYTNEVLLLNLVSMTWEMRKVYGRSPSGRGYHGSVIYDGRLLSIGGFDGIEVFNEVWILELAVHSYYSQISHFSIDMN